MIGGRTKKITNVKTEKFFMIAYEKDGETAYVAFDCKADGQKGRKVYKGFSQSKIQHTTAGAHCEQRIRFHYGLY